MNWRLRLRTVLVLVNLLILILVLGGLALSRLYDSALIRQTEAALISQGAVIASVYKAGLIRVLGDASGYGKPIEVDIDPGEHWRPIIPRLDFSEHPVHPRAADALPAPKSPEPAAMQAGGGVASIMQEAQTLTLASIRVLDYRGAVVASTGGELGLSLAHRQEVNEALNGHYASRLRERIKDQPVPSFGTISRSGTVRVFAAIPVIEKDRLLAVVALSRTPLTVRDALYEKRTQVILGALLLVAVILLVSGLISFTINRPIYALIGQAKRAEKGERDAVQPPAGPVTREVASLSENLARMTTALVNRTDYIKDFTAHVSHAFKTPLTSIQGALELLRDHDGTMSPEERRHFLGNLDQDAQRMRGLLQRLLDLARADTAEVGEYCTDIDPVVQGIARRFQADGMNVGVRTEPCRVGMDPETLGSIIGCLMENAQIHGGSNVEISVRRSAQVMVLRVTDNGPGIPSRHRPHLFEPFYTTVSGGTGIGLAVAKSLIEAHGGNIEFLDEGPGTCFQVCLGVTEKND